MDNYINKHGCACTEWNGALVVNLKEGGSARSDEAENFNIKTIYSIFICMH